MSGSMKGASEIYQHYIDGEWIASSSGRSFAVYEPSTEEVMAQVAEADAVDVDRAVTAARKARAERWPIMMTWSRT